MVSFASLHRGLVETRKEADALEAAKLQVCYYMLHKILCHHHACAKMGSLQLLLCLGRCPSNLLTPHLSGPIPSHTRAQLAVLDPSSKRLVMQKQRQERARAREQKPADEGEILSRQVIYASKRN